MTQSKTYMNFNGLLLTIEKAVRSKEAGLFYRLRYEDCDVWISNSEMQNNEKKAISDISEALGVSFLTPSRKKELREIVDNVAKFEQGAVATQPGYLNSEVYVHPNGEVTKSDTCKIEPIVVFQNDERGDTSGTIFKWKRGITKCISQDVYATFILCYAFLPLILKFAPNHVLNPFLEIIGAPLSGKTILGVMAASVYGGDPQNDSGFGQSWDATEKAFPELKRRSSDALLFMDENNIQDSALRQNGKLAFIQSNSGDRKRVGETSRKLPVRMALLSTGNKPPETFGTSNKNEIDAANSRVISLIFNEPIIQTHNDHYASSKDAVRALLNHCNEYYGTPSRKFAKNVVEANAKDEETFRRQIESLMIMYQKKSKLLPDVGDRIMDTIALTYAAGKLAEKWDILPKGCSTVIAAAKAIHRKVAAQKAALQNPELEKIKSFIKQNDNLFDEVDKKGEQNKTTNKSKQFGFVLRNDNSTKTYFIKQEPLKNALGNQYRLILRKLREDGFLVGANSLSRTFVVKAPKYIPVTESVLKINIPD